MNRLPLMFMLVAFVFQRAEADQDDISASSSVIYTEVGPAETDRQWPIYEDSLVKMVAVDYGTAEARSVPGFYVFRKAESDWVRIARVSTENATFGRNPTFEEVKKAGKAPPSIGWDFRPLAKQPYVSFPLKFADFLFFPDKVEKDDETEEYVLHFNSTWEIEGVETVLRFSAEELMSDRDDAPFDHAMGKKSGSH